MGKAHVRPVVSQKKDSEFGMASFNLNLLTIPSALITHAPRVNQSRSTDDFRSLHKDEKVVCTHYENYCRGEFDKGVPKKRPFLYHAEGTKLVQ